LNGSKARFEQHHFLVLSCQLIVIGELVRTPLFVFLKNLLGRISLVARAGYKGEAFPVAAVA
jgi:hypothetical protein